MPTYTLKNEKTGEVYEETLKISEYETLLAENPHITRVWDVTQLNIISGHGGIKVDDGFKDLLKTIKKGNYGSNIDTY